MSPLRFFPDLCRNLLAGVRLAFFLKVRPWYFTATFPQALALLGISFLLPFAQDYFATAPANRFNPFGLSYQATLYLLFLLSVFVLAWLQRDFRNSLKLIVMFLSVVPPVWFGCLLIDATADYLPGVSAPTAEWLVFGVYIAWYLSIILRTLGRFLHVSWARAFMLVLVYALINIPALFYIPGQPLWYSIASSTNDEVAPDIDINIEDTYYLQNDLLALQAGSLSRQTPGVVDMFFLGFAGFADEDVFRNETLFVKDLMERSFTGKGKAMVLINNAETLSRYPVANRHNLEAALHIIAGRMDVQEDILFLFFTSHGSKDHRLSVQMPPLGLNDLTPTQIHNALLGAGIKWKVIIISSCYSGGFLDELKDPYTLLISAAAPDRNSFGCGHDGRFTYFGEALFDHALSQTVSFEEAFEIAAARIGRRERDEGHLPSLPRMVAGEKIGEKLKVFYRHRAGL